MTSSKLHSSNGTENNHICTKRNNKFLPGDKVQVKNVKNRTDLNGKKGIVKKQLKNGRVMVKIRNTNTTDVVGSLSPNNLIHTESTSDCLRQQPIITTRPDCPICLTPLPLNYSKNYIYRECCGQKICSGCVIAQLRAKVIPSQDGSGSGTKISERSEFMMIGSSAGAAIDWNLLFCPFCRAENPKDESEFIRRLRVRIDGYNDTLAMIYLARAYKDGDHGLVKSREMAEDLYKQAYDLGDADAGYYLAGMYADKVNGNREKMMEYCEEAAKRGNVDAEYKLAHIAFKSKNDKKMVKHLVKASRAGHDNSMEVLTTICYHNGKVSEDEYASTVSAYHAATNEFNNEPRDYADRFMQMSL